MLLSDVDGIITRVRVGKPAFVSNTRNLADVNTQSEPEPGYSDNKDCRNRRLVNIIDSNAA